MYNMVMGYSFKTVLVVFAFFLLNRKMSKLNRKNQNI